MTTNPNVLYKQLMVGYYTATGAPLRHLDSYLDQDIESVKKLAKKQKEELGAAHFAILVPIYNSKQ